MQLNDHLSEYEITVEEFREMRQKNSPYTLLDVRKKWEIDQARLTPYIHIPLHDLIENLDKIPHNHPVVILCHHGIRSLNACFILKKFGFNHARSLKGGIEEWSKKIDKNIPHYTKGEASCTNHQLFF